MMNTFKELISYLKNPVLESDTNTDLQYRLTKFFHLLIISIITATLLTPLFSLVEALGLVNMESHAMKDIMNQFSKTQVFLLAAIVAPLLEELFFRAPITLFKDKSTFRILFYLFAVFFGFVHITNFELTPNVLLLSPILVAPQVILGGYLGFIRVRFGLQWSIVLHATYNAFFILFSFAADTF
ncbi:CPBP family intramembrane glutamic endopeptidase [Tenacibaculum agarivorans]|uniref:CPBP family intramembrane glutamic endopeptidase n=1 Tax=Tenacibaculum agarivorans TaxID=1908389 RepID=UPI00094BB979|nr:CPBP family intramembrane glutamic endopeptidase [Tenacibaculum agarivorans]